MGNSESSPGLEHLHLHSEDAQVYEDWTMAPGELDGVPVTVFSAAHPLTSRKRPYIERALQASRVYRHPGLLKYIDGGIVGNEVVVVTERALPLLHQDLQHLSPLHISAGLRSLIHTLVFLHDRAGVSHNNICAGSVFVTNDGAWKLWGLEYSCSFGELTRDHIEHINSYCFEKSIPPDDKTRISPAYQHARDSYAFACLIDDVLTPNIIAELSGAEDFLSMVEQQCMNRDWSERPRLEVLAEHPLFTHHFLDLQQNLTNLLLLPDNEREQFIKNAAESLRNYPEEVVSSTLSAALLSRPLLLHPAASTHLMPAVLIPKREVEGGIHGGIFSPDVYERHIVPHLVRLFSVHDATIRTLLLTYLPEYVALIPKDVLAQQVLPELLLGIRDNSDTMITATLHALACLVPILGADTVIGSNRQNIFTTAKPKAAASLPVNKSLSARQQMVSTEEGKIASNNLVKTEDQTPRSTASSEPPPPPPRSTSLVGTSQDLKLEDASLDNISLDGIISAHIPERSSPDGGEDSTATPTMVVPGISEITGNDSEAWSDWEEMQDMPAGDYSNVFLSLNQEVQKDIRQEEGNSFDRMHFNNSDTKFNTNSVSKLFVDKKNEDYKSVSQCSIKNASHSSGMKLKGCLSNKEAISKIDFQSKRIPNLGEEFDVLAIKVKKKRDEEIDLFADIVPTVCTKKYDLETMLMEANSSKKQVHKKSRSPSVSETLAGLDMSIDDVGAAWQDEEDGWGDKLDLTVESPLSLTTVSPSKIVGEKSCFHSSPTMPCYSSAKDTLLSDMNGKIFFKTSINQSILQNDISGCLPPEKSTTSETKDGWDDSWVNEF